MSFDIDIEVDHGDGYTSTFEVVSGHTYNLAPMWRKALKFEGSTSWLDGKTCAELRQRVIDGMVEIAGHPAEYEELNPPNGWGDFDGFREIFGRFHDAVLRHPKGRVVWDG